MTKIKCFMDGKYGVKYHCQYNKNGICTLAEIELTLSHSIVRLEIGLHRLDCLVEKLMRLLEEE